MLANTIDTQDCIRAVHFKHARGQFLSSDPIGFAGGDENLYRYVGNNPHNFVDPSGKIILAVPLGAAALIVAIQQMRIIKNQTEQIIKLESEKAQNVQEISRLLTLVSKSESSNKCDSKIDYNYRRISVLQSTNEAISEEKFKVIKSRNDNVFFGLTEAPFSSPIGLLHAIYDKYK